MVGIMKGGLSITIVPDTRILEIQLSRKRPEACRGDRERAGRYLFR